MRKHISYTEAPRFPCPVQATFHIFIPKKVTPYLGHVEITDSHSESMGHAITLIIFLQCYQSGVKESKF